MSTLNPILPNFKMDLTPIGKNIERELKNLERIFPIKIEKYVIMPNHIHFIVNFGILKWNGNEKNDIERADTRPAPTLGDVVCVFKSKTSFEYIKCNKKAGQYKRLWQKNYYEHIIQNEKEYYHIWKYIENNPQKYANRKAQF